MLSILYKPYFLLSTSMCTKLKELFESFIDKVWILMHEAQTWDFIAVAFFCIGIIFALIDSFLTKEKYRGSSLRFFLIGAILWITAILVQSSPLALTEIQRIGLMYSLLSIFGLLLALYGAWTWVKKNKQLGLIGTIIGISAMIFFVWGWEGVY